MSDAQALIKIGLTADRARRACARLAATQRLLEVAVRRSLPYLARRKVPVSSEPARAALRADVMEGLENPTYLAPLCVARAPKASGALVLDAKAIAHGLDGLLGSGKGDLPTLDPGGLSGPQTALASRLARSLVAGFDEVLAPMGASLALATEPPSTGGGSVLIACTVTIGEGDNAGKIMLLVPAAAIDADSNILEDKPRIVADTQIAVGDAEIEIVAELGRVRLPLARVGTLRVGDVIRLPLSVDSPARLLATGHGLFSGKPTTKGSQIAIEISGHGT